MGVYVRVEFYSKNLDDLNNHVPLLHTYQVSKQYAEKYHVDMPDVNAYSQVKWGWRSLEMLANIPFLSDHYDPLDFIPYYFGLHLDNCYGKQILLFEPTFVLKGVNTLLKIIQIGRDNRVDMEDLDDYDEENRLIRLKTHLEKAIAGNLLCRILVT